MSIIDGLNAEIQRVNPAKKTHRKLKLDGVENSGKAEGSNAVEVSARASSLQSVVNQKLQETDGVRWEIVNRLKAEFENNKYKVDEAKIDKIVDKLFEGEADEYGIGLFT